MYGDNAMVITQIKEWFNRFKNGSTSDVKQNQDGDVFFDICAIVLHEYAPEGQTVTVLSTSSPPTP